MIKKLKYVLCVFSLMFVTFMNSLCVKADVTNANFVVAYYDNNDELFADYPYYAITYEDGFFYLIYSSNPFYARQDSDDRIVLCSPANGEVGRFRYFCFRDGNFDSEYRSGFSDDQCGFSKPLIYSNHDIHTYYYYNSEYTFSEDVFFWSPIVSMEQTAKLPTVMQAEIQPTVIIAVSLLACLIGCLILPRVLHKFL